MKHKPYFRFPILFAITLMLFNLNSPNIYAQDTEQHTVRLKAYYFKIMDGERYLDIGAVSKINKKTVDVENIELIIFNEFDDEKQELGRTTTNRKGKSRFIIADINALQADSSHMYQIKVSFTGNDAYKRASKTIRFKDASIEASVVTQDSINYIAATLKDQATQAVIGDESLNVQVQRLFRPLKIGETFNNTDAEGKILVPIKPGIPGVNGVLTLEVVLNDHDDYGTVKASVQAPVGIPITYESTFDERTMWSPRNKTPYFLLIVPNLLTLGLWAVIFFLIYNLYKIAKS